MRAIADEQAFVDINSQSAQAIYFGHKRDWIDNHAVSDHADFAAPQNSRRNQMQHVFHAAVDDCVPGIIAALAADNYVCPRSKHVDNLAFALVAPLHSNQNCVRHVKSKMGKNFPDASCGTQSGLAHR
jgi:hypothetical protein